MKKIKYLLILVLCISFASCEDMLTRYNPDQPTPDNFWKNKGDVEKGLAAVYSYLECRANIWYFNETKFPVELYREDLYDYGENASSEYPTWIALYKFTYNNYNTEMSRYWQYQNIGINRSNQVIHYLSKMGEDKISNADKKEMLAEAKFLRAYYSLKLLLNWEKIIIRDSYVSDIKDADKLAKDVSPRKDCWEFIIKDLEESAKDLRTVESQAKGRATQGAAYSCLGLAYLTRAYEENNKEFFKNASDAFEKVKGYELVEMKNYAGMFDGSNENSSESILELQFSSAPVSGAYYGQKTAVVAWIASPDLGGWDEIWPNEKLIDEYKKEQVTLTTGEKTYDPRLYANIYIKNNKDDNDKGIADYYNCGLGKIYGKDYNERIKKVDRPSFRKYLSHDEDEQFKEGASGLNIPIIRYANVLLLQAEAYNEQNRPDLAIPLINKVRNRALLPNMTGTSQEAVRQQINHERIVELPLEGFRWYDLRRWGKIKSELNSVGRTFPDGKEFYPIPLAEIQSNPGIKK